MKTRSIIANIASRHLRALLPILAVGLSLTGCGASQRPSDEYLASHGYWYHDGNHQDGSSGSSSPEAQHNALHGTWLWSPAEVDIPN